MGVGARDNAMNDIIVTATRQNKGKDDVAAMGRVWVVLAMMVRPDIEGRSWNR